MEEVLEVKVETWGLDPSPSDGLSSEVYSTGHDRSHVDPGRFYDRDGDARCVSSLLIYDWHEESKTDKRFHGSAVATEPDMLLTAAHNLRGRPGDPKSVHRTEQVEARIGYHVDGQSKGPTVEVRHAIRAVVPRAWKETGWRRIHDMGYLLLDSPFRELDPVEYKAPPQHATNVRVLGYPGNNRKQVSHSCANPVPAGCMYDSEAVASLTTRTGLLAGMLEYNNVSTIGGDSGGPVVLAADPRTVVATHTGGDEKTETNFATPVDVAFGDACRALLRNLPRGLSRDPRFVTMQLTDKGWKATKISRETKMTSPVSSPGSSRHPSIAQPSTSTVLQQPIKQEHVVAGDLTLPKVYDEKAPIVSVCGLTDERCAATITANSPLGVIIAQRWRLIKSNSRAR